MGIGTRRDHAGGAVKTTLSADITTASTSCTITSATGWPTGGVGPFFVVADAGLASEEKILVASRSGTTLTFQGGLSGRGQDGTSNTGHTANAGTWYPCWTAVEADELNAHIAASADVHGRTGSMVDTADAQTVANKTFNTSTFSGGTLTGTIAGSPTLSGAPIFSGAPTISDFTNMGHTHAAAASGALLPTAAPTASAVGDTSVTGTATTYSRTDHKHAREAFGSVTAQTSFGLSSGNGSATTLSHSDHTHGTPADPIKIAAVFASATGDQSFGTSDQIVVSAPAITGDGSTKVKISITWHAINPNAGITLGKCKIKESTTVLQELRWETVDGTVSSAGGTTFVIITPTAASHTYDFAVIRDSGPAGSTLSASTTHPAIITVEQFR